MQSRQGWKQAWSIFLRTICEEHVFHKRQTMGDAALRRDDRNNCSGGSRGYKLSRYLYSPPIMRRTTEKGIRMRKRCLISCACVSQLEQ